MNNIFIFLTLGMILKLTASLTYFKMAFYLFLLMAVKYLTSENSLVNLMILLEMMTMNLLFIIVMLATSIETSFWVIITILVFSAVEASLGLSLLVFLSRKQVSPMKMNTFQ